MRIWALWGVRKGFEDSMPELMVAWDGYSAMDNDEGWEKDCADAKASWGDDLVAWRMIEHVVDEDFLRGAFDPAVERSAQGKVIQGG